MPQQKTSKPQRYSHPVYRFAITPPPGWQVVEPGPGKAIVAFVGPVRGGAPPHISIEVHDAKGLTLEKYTRESKQSAKRNLQDYVLLSERDRRVGNLKAHEVNIAFRERRILVGARILYTISGGRLYVVNSTCLLPQFSRNAAIFEKALATFRVW